MGIITKIGIVLIIAALGDYLSRSLFKRLESKSNNGPWLGALVQTLTVFSPWIIWGVALFLCIEVFTAETACVSLDIVSSARNIFLIGAASWAILFFKKVIESSLLKETDDVNSRTIIDIVSRITTIAVLIISTLMVLDTFGVPLRTLLAFGGLGGLAVSWAAKDVIANFFGGLMIYINRPFLIGDWIKSPNKSFEGVVENIGWYMTQIRTFERRPTYIPNALITDAIVENPGRMYNRRIKVIVGLRYCDVKKVSQITKAIEEMLRQHPEIDQRQHLMVHLLDFGNSSLNIEVYTFTKTTNWARYRDIQQDVLLKIADIVALHDAEIAFPTRTIQMERSSS